MKDKPYIKAFLEWLDDDSILDKYEHHTFPDFHILFNIFLYSPEEEELETNILNIDGKSLSKESRELIIPYAKVIKKGYVESAFYKKLTPGTIISLTDEITQVQTNPQYEMWREIKKERPAPEIDKPPQFIGFISTWYRHQYTLDKLERGESSEDSYDLTFCMPQSTVKSIVDRGFFNKYRVSEVIQPEV
jgi:hypothetical protein